MAPFPHPAHRTGQADFPHPALGQDFTLSRATPSAASEHLLELIGFPISRSFTTYCVCLELRSLPSTGITRLQRYYEPLRHPRAPDLSLAGIRLAIAGHTLGLPVLRTLSLCTCCRHYPGAAAGRTLRSASPSRISLPRKGCRVGLRIVLFEACSAFTRVTACTLVLSPIRDTLTRRLQPFRFLHSCSGCFRLEPLPGGPCTHWKAPPCHGARRKRSFKISTSCAVAVIPAYPTPPKSFRDRSDDSDPTVAGSSLRLMNGPPILLFARLAIPFPASRALVLLEYALIGSLPDTCMQFCKL